eukprot:1143063-Pelagomonas_calceolata.AAC.6
MEALMLNPLSGSLHSLLPPACLLHVQLKEGQAALAQQVADAAAQLKAASAQQDAPQAAGKDAPQAAMPDLRGLPELGPRIPHACISASMSTFTHLQRGARGPASSHA